jgi:nucleoside-diphosphate-sugar epimerase
MQIAMLGATSQIAKDLIIAFSKNENYQLTLFARRPEAVNQWLAGINLSEKFVVADFDSFTIEKKFDAIFNFVGVGDPARAVEVGASIFDATLKYDELVLDYLKVHPHCRYIFLSSGAAYGMSFDVPVNINTKSVIDINNIQPQDWYAVAKLHTECRHRSLPHLSIIDIRVFNYFSHTQDISARFLITDIVRALLDKTVLKTSSDYIVRDFIHPSDFHKLVLAVMSAPANNVVVDCYSLSPIDKPNLLQMMQENFGLRYEITETDVSVNAFGSKPYYYSLNKKAKDFGYQPRLTSWEGIKQEIKLLL